MISRLSVAEKEGFEPSIPLWGIHDFQSCALDQTTRLLHVLLESFAIIKDSPHKVNCFLKKETAAVPVGGRLRPVPLPERGRGQKNALSVLSYVLK